MHIESGGYDWLKLGFSRDIRNRIQQYGLPTDTKVKLICTVQFHTGKAAHAAEAALHKNFNRQKLSKKTMALFHQVQGANECYPSKLKTKIIKALEVHDSIGFPDAVKIVIA